MRSALMAPMLIVICAAALGGPGDVATSRLDGNWVLDGKSAEEFDAKLAQLAKEARARWRPRGMRNLTAVERAATFPDELPPENNDELQQRLGETWRPPRQLTITSGANDVRITSDDGPSRSYSLTETQTRMDTSGTADISTNWNNGSLVITSRYTHKARADQQYSVDKNGDWLRVKLQLNDPGAGKLEMLSVYRRRS
jgi:hypothetical protein